ncbi:ABC-type Fe3+-hydroxamate transport system, substrate-binding protein [Pontibacter akesuensis]|uniref:ABC-type Fe3+-hydroxamate transport system, substrate-binding protein n=2 Tax=Pontibacter akesuensis TaxID=388950 RepID=A0A1I7K090_9BACT|nr:iron ABC transporter [Pontibacter akesuensis]SFU90886.1 ABC-type Fe3+-hydroxamate transport system, substrate-binding protein [Pontibacter akesuensis]
MTITDQMGHQLTLAQPPQRIMSLVPSQTELLFDLGLADRVVGVTKFCIHPKEQVKQKTIIGGTKNFHFGKIDQLQPDLIIGNKEENYKEGIEQLQEKYKVWMSDIYTLEDALEMLQQLGLLTGTEAKAQELEQQIRVGFEQLEPVQPSIKTAYFIWRKPYMAVGSHNIIDHILQRCGFSNAFANLQRYPEITPALLQQADPQLILLSSEPYPFKEKHIEEFRELCPQAVVKVVDGEMFSWYGSRLLHAPVYLQQVINEVKENLS